MNPILQQMSNRNNGGSNPLLTAMMNPQKAITDMVQNNPQFKQFMAENKGLSPEQIMSKYNLDPNLVKNFMR